MDVVSGFSLNIASEQWFATISSTCLRADEEHFSAHCSFGGAHRPRTFIAQAQGECSPEEQGGCRVLGQKHVCCVPIVYVVSSIPVNVASFVVNAYIPGGGCVFEVAMACPHTFLTLYQICAHSAGWCQFSKTALQLAKDKMHYACAQLLVRE